LGHVTRFALALRHERHVKAQIPQPAVAWAAARGLDVARAALIAARAAAPALDHRLVWVNEADVDERFDQLWREAAPSYAIVGVRDRAFVIWRFFRRAEGRIAVIALEQRKTRKIAGYAAVEQVGDAWHVRDLFAPIGDLSTLLRLLCFELLKRGASSISLRILGPADVMNALASNGFRERADKRTFVCGVGKSAAA